MTALVTEIINKYQRIAPNQVIHAVAKAASRTGADFSFLMEKASTESNFNPAAKSRHSSATGLFQFIESTWLKMVKDHGAKYGLSALADKIEIKNGKPCVQDCRVRDAILSLRKNPEISALMAGEFSTENKQYLENHTRGTVGATELYLAHFMGAGGAAKFLNAQANNGHIVAAQLFPKEARANKNIFFNAATGQPRTLNDIYRHFSHKFKTGTDPSSSAAPVYAEAGSIPPAPAHVAFSPSSAMDIAQALSSSDIIWNDESSDKSGFSHSATFSGQKLAAAHLLVMAQMQKQPHYNV